MPILDHFSFIAPFYERLFPVRDEEYLIRVLNLPVNGAILDAGGGTGRVAKVLEGYAQIIVVADLSLGMLSQIAGKNRLLSVNSSTEYLPFRAEAFERIIMVDALHHVVNHAETGSELWRVLKPGGRIVIQEPNINKFSVKLVALAEKLALMRSHFISPKAISKLFKDPGARVQVELTGFNAWVIIEKPT